MAATYKPHFKRTTDELTDVDMKKMVGFINLLKEIDERNNQRNTENTWVDPTTER